MPLVLPPTKYPPVNSNPTVEDCLRALRVSDYCQWAGATVASWGYGFVVGRPARFTLAGLMAGIGFTFGSMVVVQNTRGRLMGFRENEREQRMYGKEDPAAAFKIHSMSADGRAKLDWTNYN